MPSLLRLLILEDSPTDAGVMVRHLREAGYAPDWQRVETEAEFLAHLEPNLDLLLIDYTLPDLKGRRALEILRDRGWEIPSIIVTDTVSDESALEFLQLGAVDYLLKDRLTRLGAAVRRALAQRTTQRERVAAEAAWQASEARLRFLADVVEKSSQPFEVGYPDGRVGICNAALCTLLGYSQAELRALDWSRDLTPREWRVSETERLAELRRTGQPVRYEKECLRKDGSRIPVEVLVHLARDAADSPPYYYVFLTDLTERKRAEQATAERTRQLEAVHASTTQITQELGLSTLLHLIIYHATELTRAVSGVVYLWDGAAQSLSPRAWRGYGDWVGSVHLALGQGLTGVVAERRQGMIINDYQTSPYAHPLFLARTGITAAVAEPLLFKDRLMGVIVVSGEGTGRRFTEQDRSILALFAAAAAIAIENAWLFATEQERWMQVEAVRTVSVEITRELDLTALLRLVTQRAVELLAATSGTLFLWQSEAQLLAPRAQYGLGDWPADLPLRLGEDVAGAVAERREGLIVNEYRTSPYALPVVLEHSGVTAVVAEPLVYWDRLLGVIALSDRRPGRSFTEGDRRRLRLFAYPAAIAIENARLFQSLSDQRALLRSLSGRLVETAEGERRQLALELHDQVGQKLTVLGLNLGILRTHLADPGNVTLLPRLDDSMKLVEQIAERIRNIMVELRPPALDEFGLMAALRWYGKQFASRSGIGTQVRGEEPLPRLSPSVEIALFRIAQEAMTNVVKHAQATQVSVVLETEEHRVRLSIADDGVGIRTAQSLGANRQHWGLLGMEERAQAIGGRYRIESQPGGGTRIIVEVAR